MSEIGQKEQKVKCEDLDVYTRMCIENFETLMKRELYVKKAEEELAKRIVFIPENDVKGYVQITEEIRKKYEEKISEIENKMHEMDVKRGISKR